MLSFWRRFNSSQRWRCTQCDFVGQISEKAKKEQQLSSKRGPKKMNLSRYGGFLKWWASPTTIGFSYKKWPFWGGDWGYHHFRKHPYPSKGSCHMRCLELNHRTAGECANRVKPASIDMEKGFLGCQRAGKKGVSNWDVCQERCFKRVFWWLFQLSIVSFFDFTALRNAEDSIILWPDTDDESQIDAWPFFDWEKLEELVMPSKTWRPWWSVQILQTKGSARQIPHILHFNAGQRVTPMWYFSTCCFILDLLYFGVQLWKYSSIAPHIPDFLPSIMYYCCLKLRNRQSVTHGRLSPVKYIPISRGDAVDSMPPRSFAKPFCFSLLLIRSDFKWLNSKKRSRCVSISIDPYQPTKRRYLERVLHMAGV